MIIQMLRPHEVGLVPQQSGYQLQQLPSSRPSIISAGDMMK